MMVTLRASMPRFPGHVVCSVVAGATMALGSGCAGTPPKPTVTPVTTTQSLADPPPGANQTANFPTSDPAVTGKKKSPKPGVLAKSFDEAVARGDAAWLSSDADMAIYLYVQALSFRPSDPVTLAKLGVIEQRRGDLELAARAYELAANASPSDPRLSAQLGLVYLAMGEDENAHKWLLRSVDTASSDWRVYDGLGIVEERRGDSANALQHLQHAQALAPGNAAPLLHRGQAMFDVGDYVGAEAAVRDAMSHSTNPESWQLLGKIQAKRRVYTDSLDSLLEVMDPPAAYSLVARTALDNGDNAVALRYFERAATLSPVFLPEAERSANKARERLDATGR